MMILLQIMASINTALLRAGRNVAWVALALMVLVILLQVVFRYVFNNALAWTDECARFLMLWMVGLVAPSAFRWGGFVAIDMVPEALPRVVGLVLTIALLLLSLAVLAAGVRHGYAHTMGFGGNFDSSSLRIPLDWIGFENIKIKLRYMYGSMLVCVLLLLSVNLELIMRAVTGLFMPWRGQPGKDAPAEMTRAD